jgi:hypothetical protein
VLRAAGRAPVEPEGRTSCAIGAPPLEPAPDPRPDRDAVPAGD